MEVGNTGNNGNSYKLNFIILTRYHQRNASLQGNRNGNVSKMKNLLGKLLEIFWNRAKKWRVL